MSETQDKFDSWGLLELFGHLKLAGHISEQTIVGTQLIRIDIPDVDGAAGYTRFFGAQAIYSITPLPENDARKQADYLTLRPASYWQKKQLLRPIEAAEDHDFPLEPF